MNNLFNKKLVRKKPSKNSKQAFENLKNYDEGKYKPNRDELLKKINERNNEFRS